MKTVRSLPARPLARTLCALALAGAIVIPVTAQPGAFPNAGAPPPGALNGPGGPAGARGGAPGGPGAGQRGGRGGGGAPAQMGPQAPVPAAVAMARPTEAELAQLNEAVKRFIASNPIATKYASLVTVTPPRVNAAATYTRSNVRNDQRHNTFVELAKKGDIDILFHGDSITDWWQQAGAQGGKEVFEKYFGGQKIANFAIAGDTTQGLLWGLKNGEGEGFSPKAIMLMIGTNNTGSSSGPEIAEGVGAVVQELRTRFPAAKILLLAIFPRGAGPTDANRLKNDEANKIIAKLHDNQHVFFMDIGPKFLDDKGAFLPGLFRNDNLHPAAAGYEVWAQAVKDKLAELTR
jgi:lysophospholipase L1-like esterase